MPFANPLVITVNAVAKTLAKITQDNYGSVYRLREATQVFQVEIRHSNDQSATGTGKYHRANVVFTQTIFAVAPQTVNNVRIVSTTLRHGEADSAVEVSYLGGAVSGLLTAVRYEDLVAWLN